MSVLLRRGVRWLRDIPYHYVLRTGSPHEGGNVVLCVARMDQAEQAAATWPGGTPIQIVRVRGIHEDTCILVGLLILIAAVAVGMVVTASMLMGFGLLVVLGLFSALVYRGDVPDQYAWLHSDALRLSAEDTARLQALLDTIIEAQVRQRCLAACPTCGSRVDAPAESRDQPASSDPAG